MIHLLLKYKGVDNLGSFKLDESFKKQLEDQCQAKAKSLAIEIREKMFDKYFTLIDWYYADYQPKLNEYDEPYYTRTFNLYNSANKYYAKSHGSIYYGGIRIGSEKMHDYTGKSGDIISAEDLLNTYIYNPNGTWHGGDWHGGYGVKEQCFIYELIHKYRDDLYKDIQDRCTV